ncbi:DUF6049 family protein [Microbacter sp. GSS18]|nr:DUF6049 family protein [Microbacter sp. GSS18]
MTVTSQPPRASRRRAIAAVAVSGLLAFSSLSALPAAAATATPEPTPGADASGTVDLTLAPVRSGVLEPGDSLTVTMRLANGTTSVVPESPVTLGIGTEPLRSRTALSSWLAGTVSGVETTSLAQTSLSAAEPADASVRSITVPASSDALQDLDPGVYPLAAVLGVDGDPATTATSAVVVPDPDTPDAETVVIMPITAGPRTAGLLTAAELETLTAFDGSLTAQLAAAEGTPAVLAVDPAIPAAIRVLGDDAPVSAQEWLVDLLALPNDRFALQFGDADPGVQLQAGLDGPLAPLDLTAYIDPNDFTGVDESTDEPQPTGLPTPEPTESADDAGPGIPSLEDLVDIGEALGDVYWPATSSVTPETVAMLAASGSDADALTVVSSRSTGGGATGATVSARAAADAASVLVFDADSSQALSAAASADDPIDRSAAIAAATAQLSFAAAQSSGRPIAIALDRAELPTRTGSTLAMSAAEGAPGIALSSIDVLPTATQRRVTITEADADAARVAEVRRLLDGEAAIARFATILQDQTLLTGPERAEILQLLGTAWSDDPLAALSATTAHQEDVRETLDSVALLPTSDITLAGSTASLRFWVRNDLPYPADVVLLTSSDNLRLSVESGIPVAATADSNSRVVVPVQARIGNGQVSLELQLNSPTGVPIGSTQTVVVNVRAEWEGVGIAVLAVLVGGLVVAGAIRTVLRLRARRRESESASTEPTDVDSTPGAAPGAGDDA